MWKYKAELDNESREHGLVQFVSDRNSTTVYKGLKASFKAGVS